MDTLFATSKAGRSSRGNKYAQPFVTHKGFVCSVPMKSVSQRFQAVKQFAKAIGASESLIHDASKSQKTKDVRRYCNHIDISLRVLEEDTPWADKAEL